MNKNIKILGGSLIIVIIALIIYASIIEIGNPDLKSHKDYVTKNIATKDATAKNILKSLQLSQEDNFFRIDQKLNTQRQKTNAENIEIFIYQNSTLIYWSTNLIEPPPNNINSNLLWESGNGVYRIIQHKHTTFTFFAVYLIKKDYYYQNQYLQNTFNSDFQLPEETDISLKKNDEISILDTEGNFIFSIKIPSHENPKDHQIFITSLLYFLSIILILKLFQNLLIYKLYYVKHKKIYLLLFILILVLFRYALYILQFPKILYSSNIFSPYYYAYSNLIPSIGDLFTNVLFVLFFAVTVYKYTQKDFRIKNEYVRFIVASFVLSIPIVLFEIVNFVMESLVIDSRIQMDLYNIFNMTFLSVFGYIIIAMVLVSYILISIPFIRISNQLMPGRKIVFAIISVIITVFLTNISGFIQLKFSILYIFLFIFILSYFYARKSWSLNWNIVLIVTILFAIQSTHALHEFNNIREIEHRKLLAVNLSSEQRDPITEFLFQIESDKIFSDDTLKNVINDYGNENFDFGSFESYLINKYFTGYWNKFDVQITICSETDILNIQPDDIEINCINYFDELLATSTVPTESPELFFINYGPGENGYIAILDFSGSLTNISGLTVFVEFFPKISTQKLGFPDLLIDNSVSGIPEITGYSYAKYQDGDLYKRVGNYFYDIKFEPSESNSKPYSYFSLNNYNHLLYFVDDSRFLIISKEEKSILDILSPFSYLFTLYLFVSLIIIILFINPKLVQTIHFSFKTRLQLSISFVLVFSFLSIGFFTLYYINDLNNRKNESSLSEKTHSILIEMQHKFSTLDAFNGTVRDYVSDILVKFSNVFFTDINLFDVDGKLIASSRPEIFDENLISRFMQPNAFRGLRYEGKSLFIQKENIGKQEYLSAYIPFTNHVGQVIGYLNLPYFAKEMELNHEISNLLVVYVNIYVILIGISLILAGIISNYISKPVKLIIDKIKQVNLGGKNESIELERKDEIGKLVVEYNRMIDELSKSAELLARSEREYAWREMAKQVAHEIKNPLTPMKLSVQHLHRAWKNSREGWDERLEKFTRNMTEQIDSLSKIATEFSDFAKMPAGLKTKTNLVESISSSLKLFSSYENIAIDFIFNRQENYFVNGDKEQLSRVFNNLLKNSIQAIGKAKHGRIIIQLSRKGNVHEITISDNGSGIPDDIAAKIFYPNFTTKTGGMGLGLAIVKSIITSTGGDISYQSNTTQGTTFTITLPSV
jgi:signal transduction histidine kinase